MSRPSPRWMMVGLMAGLALVPLLAAEVQPRTVTVTGEAEVKVVPDVVVLTLGVETSSKDVSAAKSENDRKVKEITASVQGQGVAAKDVATDYLRIEPRYEMGSYSQRDFIGYFVQRTVVVTLRDVSKFERLLTAILQAGANYVHGIDFRTSELRKHRDTARSLAIKAAKEKAVALAGELGQKVGRPRSIEEGQAGWWSSYAGWWGRGWGQMQTQNVVQRAQEPAATGDSAFSPGTVSVKATVTVSFELE